VPHKTDNRYTQQKEVAIKQIASQEMWGGPARNFLNSDRPKVKAFKNQLDRESLRGIEFTTKVEPDPTGHPVYEFWSGDRDGIRNEDGYAKIKVKITFCNQVDDWEVCDG
jgi:hypothetical protein